MAEEPHIHEEDEEPGFLRKFGVWIVVGLVLVGGAGAWLALRGESKPKPRVAQTRMVELMPVVPPPPPPPPPPPQEPPPEQPPEVEDQPDFQPEEAPTEAPPAEEPPAADEAPLGTSIVGDGPGDGFGLAAGGGMGVIGGKGKGGGSGGTKFGWYAGQVQSRVSDALRKHPKTRSAQLVVTVRIWADSTGRVTRAAVSDSSGDPTLDRTLQNEILTGLRLQSPPPEDMPMPIVMRISARRPN